MKKRALVLDKDGVIFDSERLYRSALEQALNQHSLHLANDVYDALCGQSTETIHVLLKKALPKHLNFEKLLNDWLQQRDVILNGQGMPFVAGAEALLDWARAENIPLALVSSDYRASCLAEFAQSARPDLAYVFDFMIGFEDVKHHKPHAEPYLAAAKRFQLPPEALWVIEDSPTGAQSALNAGCKLLYLNHKKIKNAFRHLQHLDEVRLCW